MLVLLLCVSNCSYLHFVLFEICWGACPVAKTQFFVVEFFYFLQHFFLSLNDPDWTLLEDLI